MWPESRDLIYDDMVDTQLTRVDGLQDEDAESPPAQRGYLYLVLVYAPFTVVRRSYLVGQFLLKLAIVLYRERGSGRPGSSYPCKDSRLGGAVSRDDGLDVILVRSLDVAVGVERIMCRSRGHLVDIEVHAAVVAGVLFSTTEHMHASRSSFKFKDYSRPVVGQCDDQSDAAGSRSADNIVDPLQTILACVDGRLAARPRLEDGRAAVVVGRVCKAPDPQHL